MDFIFACNLTLVIINDAGYLISNTLVCYKNSNFVSIYQTFNKTTIGPVVLLLVSLPMFGKECLILL